MTKSGLVVVACFLAFAGPIRLSAPAAQDAGVTFRVLVPDTAVMLALAVCRQQGYQVTVAAA